MEMEVVKSEMVMKGNWKMVYGIGLFLLGVVGLTARGLYFGIFDITEWASLSLLLPAAYGAGWIERIQQKRDGTFCGVDAGYASRLGERVSTGVKQIYRADVAFGTYRRTFHKPWHRWFIAFPKVEGFFLNLVFDVSNQQLQLVEKPNQRLWSNQTEWWIEEGGETVGEIKTDHTFRHAAAFSEVLQMTYRTEQYQIRSSKLSRRIEVLQQGTTIATSKRKRNLLTFDVPKQDAHVALIAGMVLFRFHYRE